MKLINVSNTTLSLNGKKRHRKFDAKQSKRHDFGTEVCAVCDKVFTKYHWRTTVCSEECKREKINAQKRKYREENREKIAAQERKYREENREEIAAQKRKYYEANRETIKAKYEENRKDPEWVEKINAKYEENRKDPEWVEKINARQLARYHAKKEK